MSTTATIAKTAIKSCLNTIPTSPLVAAYSSRLGAMRVSLGFAALAACSTEALGSSPAGPSAAAFDDLLGNLLAAWEELKIDSTQTEIKAEKLCIGGILALQAD
eukprot:scaffold135641_cov21-Prasinocladus_malaysianus.AAC.1